MPLGVLFIMKTPEDEQYIAIKVYKLNCYFETFFVLLYCMSTLSLHIESTTIQY